MSMGIVSDKEFNDELNRAIPKSVPSTIIKKPEIIEPIKPGRKEGDVNVPESIRKLIGSTANIEGRAEALKLAKELGLSPSSVSAYTKGATSTASYETQEPALIKHITDAKSRVSKKARAKLMQSLHRMTSEKMNDAKLTELSSVAKDMSVIIKNMEPKVPESSIDNSRKQVNFVLFAPEVVPEETFDVIDVKE